MNKQQKEAKISLYDEELTQSSFALLTSCVKLSVLEVERLRHDMAKEGSTCVVVKNTLARIVFERHGLNEVCDFLVGPSMIFFGHDEIAPSAKLLQKLQRKHPTLKVKAILYEGGVYPREELAHFASMPTKTELQSQCVGVFIAPISKFLRVLSVTQRLAVVLKQYADKHS